MTDYVGGDSSQKYKNQDRLIQQNRKLNEEIRKLEGQMSKVITDNVAESIENLKTKTHKTEKMEELSAQQNYIKKLKNKLAKMKALHSYEKNEDIRREEDQIFVLKREYEALQKEKELLGKVCSQKKQALQSNRPISTLKTKTEEKLSKLKQQNGQLMNKIVHIQRQIRKYHKEQQMHKSYKDQKIIVENPDFEMNKLEHEKKSWERRAKAVEDKWKPQFDNLDNQFLTMKQIVIRREKLIQDSEKEFRMWQTRASAARSESDILLDRQRMTRVAAQSPPKKKKQSLDRKFTRDLKNREEKGKVNLKKEGTTTSMAKSIRLQSSQKRETMKIDQKQTERKWNMSENESKEVRQKQAKENVEKPQKQEKANKILTSSVGVGTSFYYNEDQD